MLPKLKKQEKKQIFSAVYIIIFLFVFIFKSFYDNILIKKTISGVFYEKSFGWLIGRS